ncbi:MAG: hypothetical protein JO325_17575 [Solirubrobacterales bacterium]|nr:hypothetical protein [Solirubrobacterales bacterium]
MSVGTGALVSTIPGVIARLQAIDGALPRKGGVPIFNRLYLQVTLAVDSASAGTEFENRPFLDRLDVIFAGLYFDAETTIDSGGSCPVVWRPLGEARSDAREPIQFALAGMAAHINHDLPIAVVATSEELGLAPEKTDEALAMWSLVGARDVAWAHAKLLWDMRHAGPLREAYLDTLACTTELAARAMLV